MLRFIAWVRPAWAWLLWGESPLYETESFQVLAYQMLTSKVDFKRQVLEGNCARGDRPWGGSLRSCA